MFYRMSGYETCGRKLRDQYPDSHQSDAFRRGSERGGAYLEAIKEGRS